MRAPGCTVLLGWKHVRRFGWRGFRFVLVRAGNLELRGDRRMEWGWIGRYRGRRRRWHRPGVRRPLVRPFRSALLRDGEVVCRSGGRLHLRRDHVAVRSDAWLRGRVLRADERAMLRGGFALRRRCGRCASGLRMRVGAVVVLGDDGGLRRRESVPGGCVRSGWYALLPGWDDVCRGALGHGWESRHGGEHADRQRVRVRRAHVALHRGQGGGMHGCRLRARQQALLRKRGAMRRERDRRGTERVL